MYNDFGLSFNLSCSFHGIRYLWIIRLNYVLGDFWTRRSNEHGREDETRLSPFLRCLRNVRFQSDVLNYIDIKHAKMYLYIPCWLSYYQLIEVWSNFRRVGGSGTMILSKWEILETDTYSFTLHGHLHQVIYYFHSFAINWNSNFIDQHLVILKCNWSIKSTLITGLVRRCMGTRLRRHGKNQAWQWTKDQCLYIAFHGGL